MALVEMAKNFRNFQSQCHRKEKLGPTIWVFLGQKHYRGRGCFPPNHPLALANTPLPAPVPPPTAPHPSSPI